LQRVAIPLACRAISKIVFQEIKYLRVPFLNLDKNLSPNPSKRLLSQSFPKLPNFPNLPIIPKKEVLKRVQKTPFKPGQNTP